MRKSSEPIYENKEKKLISKINNEYENFANECKKNQNKKNDNKKKLSKQVIKTISNIKRLSFSFSKNKITNNGNNFHTVSITENNYCNPGIYL